MPTAPPAGRDLPRTDAGGSLVAATGQGETFAAVRRSVVRPCDNPPRATQARPAKSAS